MAAYSCSATRGITSQEIHLVVQELIAHTIGHIIFASLLSLFENRRCWSLKWYIELRTWTTNSMTLLLQTKVFSRSYLNKTMLNNKIQDFFATQIALLSWSICPPEPSPSEIVWSIIGERLAQH
ncbi:hypothetical protein TNIN_204471 [Trichonephila inaurata madagascariensis]|uniref:Uncharacterized protein n=1 Tax=Trichonephila inaurata madagascariensis TaxID=2747483 RepID=A0A8X6YX26_9ARAC|nr:hypothetical protein TNIN_204471 [Trichonephila inaurata madagascariensis]